MDMRRLMIAVVASVVIVLGWNYISPYLGITPPVSVVEPHKPVETSTPSKQIPSSLATERASAVLTSPVLTIETPLYKAEIAVDGGTVRSFVLKKYFVTTQNTEQFKIFTPEAIRYAPLGLLINAIPTWGGGTWTASADSINIAKGTSRTVRFEGIVDGKKIIRELTFFADTYLISENTKVSLIEGTTEAVQLAYSVGTGNLSINSSYNETTVAWFTDDAVDTEVDKETLEQGLELKGTIPWAGIMDHYFLVAIAPNEYGNITLRSKYEGDIFRTAMYLNPVTISTAPTEFSTSYWVGPKEEALLIEAPNALSASINYGFFSFLSKPLVLFLEFIYKYVHNYGLAIIILTVVIKLLFWPLSQKSFTSMNKMKKVQPLVQEIREKHKDNKEEMNKAIMNLYKVHKVNPMGGCLPLLVQIPVFFALYEALLNSVALRHAIFIEYLPFTKIVWLADLSTKDPLYITPIAMGISMFIQQLITPSVGDPTQRKIMLAMPVVFTIFFLGFPSGLVIYWLSSNIISIIQQSIMLRKSNS